MEDSIFVKSMAHFTFRKGGTRTKGPAWDIEAKRPSGFRVRNISEKHLGVGWVGGGGEGN